MFDLTRRRAIAGLFLLAFASELSFNHEVARGACPHCGCQAPCRKVCRLEKDEKKITTTCWGCKCEDFCIPGPSEPCCEHCELVCKDPDAAKEGVACVKPKRLVWTEWLPGCCAEVRTRKKLMKRVVTKKVPSFKWVVEDLCDKCQAGCQVVEAPSAEAIPPLPEGDFTIIRNVKFTYEREENSAPSEKSEDPS